MTANYDRDREFHYRGARDLPLPTTTPNLDEAEVEAVARAIVRERHRFCCEHRPVGDFPIGPFELGEARAALRASAQYRQGKGE